MILINSRRYLASKKYVRRSFNFLKALYLIIRYYKLSFKRTPVDNPCIIFMVDGRLQHGGLADRLKGIVSCYAISKAENIPFKIYFNYPFKLEKILLPNEYDWTVDDKGILYNFPFAFPVVWLGDRNLWIYKQKRHRHQYHLYFNMNLLSEINVHYKTNFEWGELFNELFLANNNLLLLLNNQKRILGDEYIGLVFRFQALLGDFYEGSSRILGESEREHLLDRAFQAVEHMHEKFLDVKILVTSDSSTFLKKISVVDNVYVNPGLIFHMGYAKNKEEEELYLKSFFDFFTLADSRKICSISVDGMRHSGFSECASWVKNIPFEKIDLYNS